MSDPYIGEIRLFAFPRIPTNWALCDGSLIAIGQNEALYTLIGTTYGGDGVNNFALPDLRGRVPIDQGAGGGLTPRVMGQYAGEENHTLTSNEMASHSHSLVATSNTGNSPTPSLSVHLAAISVSTEKMYTPQGNVTSYETMANSVTLSGNSLPHNNIMPTLTSSYCICLYGIYPTPS